MHSRIAAAGSAKSHLDRERSANIMGDAAANLDLLEEEMGASLSMSISTSHTMATSVFSGSTVYSHDDERGSASAYYSAGRSNQTHIFMAQTFPFSEVLSLPLSGSLSLSPSLHHSFPLPLLSLYPTLSVSLPLFLTDD